MRFFVLLLSLIFLSAKGWGRDQCQWFPCPPVKESSPGEIRDTPTPVPPGVELLPPAVRKPSSIPWREWATSPEIWTILGVRSYLATGLERPRACRLRGGEGVFETGLRFRKPNFLGSQWTFEGYALFKGGVYDFLHDDYRTLFLDLRELKITSGDPLLRLPSRWTFTLGRQYMAEESGLWYRNYLDAIRADYRKGRWGFYLIGATRFEDSRVSNSEESIDLENHLYALGRFYFRDWFRALSLELLYENVDPDRKHKYQFFEAIVPQNSLLWLNLEGGKRWASGFRVWFRFSKIFGRSERMETLFKDSCSGKRFLVDKEKFWAGGKMWETGLAYFDEVKGLGFLVARGDGQNPYLQPRLANNRRRIFGWERFRVFGDLVNPRLENLFLWEIMGGVRLPEIWQGESWLECLFLGYRRLEPEKPLRISRHIAGALRPEGKDLGKELDILFEWRRKGSHRNLTLRLVGAYFWPEGAFYSDKPAYKVYLWVRWLFKH